MLLVLGATEFELADLRSRLLQHDGQDGDGRILICRTGCGRHTTERAVRRALHLVAPALALNVGFAGALRHGLAEGEVYLVQRVCSTEPGHDAACQLDPSLLDWAGKLLQPHGARLAELATATAPVCSPAEKLSLGRATGAALVDMEGYWLARMLGWAGIPLLMLKVVSDRAEQRLPSGLPTSGRRLTPELLFHVLRRPRAAADLLRLARTSFRARRVLGPLATELARQWLHLPSAPAGATA